MKQFSHLDFEALADKMGGEPELVKELAAVASSDLARQLEELNQSGSEGDAQNMRSKAHAIKGALGNLEAHKANELACRVEMAAKQGDPALALAGLGELNQEMRRLIKELDRLAGE